MDMSNRSRRTPAKTGRQIQSGHRRRIRRSYNWIQPPCRDGATCVFGNDWFLVCYEMTCGFPAKKRSTIHTQIKWYLIINVLQVCPWRRPATLVSVFAVTYCNINHESYLSNFRRWTPAKTVRQIQSGHRRRIRRSYNWIQPPRRDGATCVFGNDWFSVRYKMTCGFPAQKKVDNPRSN